MFQSITAKLGTMRKPQNFVIQLSNKGNFYVQSDKSIGKFNMHTGEGVLNIKGSYFVHLNAALGAKPYKFPPEFVKECFQKFVLKGDIIGDTPDGSRVIYAGITEIG